jgi:hypothetical protein
MSGRAHLDDEAHPVRALQAAAERLERDSPDVAFDAARRGEQPGRGGDQVLARSIDGLQASAGNGAVVSLLGHSTTRHKAGTTAIHAARAAVVEEPTLQRAPGDDDQKTATGGTTDPNALAGRTDSDSSGDTGGSDGNTGGSDGQQLGNTAPTPGKSWTKVGPPTNSTYSVSGSLRTVANAIAARTEAGSVATSPTQDTETYTPDGGTEKVTAARVTVDQKMEMPDWSDKANATKGQQDEWTRFFGALTTHENGHVDLDKTAYANVHSKMVGQTPTDATAALDAAEAKATTDNTTYDTNNDHGKKQGTGINPNIDEVTKVP